MGKPKHDPQNFPTKPGHLLGFVQQRPISCDGLSHRGDTGQKVGRRICKREITGEWCCRRWAYLHARSAPGVEEKIFWLDIKKENRRPRACLKEEHLIM